MATLAPVEVITGFADEGGIMTGWGYSGARRGSPPEIIALIGMPNASAGQVVLQGERR